MSDDPKDEPKEATSFAETLHRHEQDDAAWVEAEAVTGRPADKPLDNSTLASRKKSATKKAVTSDEAENKAVTSAATKAPRKPRGK